MQTTSIYGFNVVEGTDIVNPLTQLNPNFTNLDTDLDNIYARSINFAAYSKSGTVHAISSNRLKPGNQLPSFFRFIPTSDFTTGDTMTVNGNAYPLKLFTGETPETGAFTAGVGVLGCLLGGNVIIYGKPNMSVKASDVTATDGDSVQDYIDNTKFKNIETWTPNIGENWETFLARIRDNSTKTIPANFIRCTVDGVSGLIFRQSRRTTAISWQYETDYFTGNSLVKYAMSVGSDSAVLRKYDVLNGTVQNLSSADAQTINIYGLDV